MTQTYKKEERHEIYKEALRIFIERSVTDTFGTNCLCAFLEYGANNLYGNGRYCDMFFKQFHEFNLFKRTSISRLDPWFERGRKGYKIRVTVLKLCIEMTR